VRRPSLPQLALAVAVLGVSWSAILVRWSDAPSDVVAFYRVLFTLALLAPVAVLRHSDAFRAISRRDLLTAVGAGVALAAHFLAWIESLNWTTVAASVTLVQTQPVFVAVGAVLVLDERVDSRTVVGIVAAVAGAAALAAVQGDAGLPAGGVASVGNGLALLGAVSAAGYVLVGRSLRQRIPVLPYVTVVYAACSVALFVAVAVDGAAVRGALDPSSGGGAAGPVVGSGQFAGYPLREWLLFLAMALGPGILGHTVVNWALEHCARRWSASHCSASPSVRPSSGSCCSGRWSRYRSPSRWGSSSREST